MNELNLGCGKDYKEGFINLDNNKNIKADVYHDLNIYPYPFKDNYFDYVLASHIVEHLDEPLKFIEEIKRILKDDGELCVVVPHFTNPMAYTSLHKSYFSYKTVRFDGMATKSKVLCFTKKYWFMEVIARRFPLFYENSPLRVFQAKEVKGVFVKNATKTS